MWRQRYTGKMQCDVRGRNWSESAASEGTPKLDSHPQKLEEPRKRFSPTVSEGPWPEPPWFQTSIVRNCEKASFSFILSHPVRATFFFFFFYHNPRKQIHSFRLKSSKVCILFICCIPSVLIVIELIDMSKVNICSVNEWLTLGLDCTKTLRSFSQKVSIYFISLIILKLQFRILSFILFGIMYNTNSSINDLACYPLLYHCEFNKHVFYLNPSKWLKQLNLTGTRRKNHGKPPRLSCPSKLYQPINQHPGYIMQLSRNTHCSLTYLKLIIIQHTKCFAEILIHCLQTSQILQSNHLVKKRGREFVSHNSFSVNSCLLGISHFFSNYIAKTAWILLVNGVQLPNQWFPKSALASILKIISFLLFPFLYFRVPPRL